MAENTVADESLPARTDGAELSTREPERYLVPAVDIYETKAGLKLVADMPGVGKEGLHVRVDNGVLTIEGKPSFEAPAVATHEEFSLQSYFRQFQLNEEVDQDRIQADYRHGVLSLTLPRAEKAKPKQIPVKLG